MDPFLEEPSLWGSVHTRLMNAISDPLAELVSPDFYVDIQQHVTILHPEAEAIRHIIPDVYVVEPPPVAQQQTRTSALITQPTLANKTVTTLRSPASLVLPVRIFSARYVGVYDAGARSGSVVLEVIVSGIDGVGVGSTAESVSPGHISPRSSAWTDDS